MSQEPPPSALPAPIPAPSWRDRAVGACEALSIKPVHAVLGGIALVCVVAFLVVRGSAAPAELELPQAGSPGDPGAATAGGTEGAATDGTTATSQPSGPAHVHAAGALAQPGLYRLPPGARVADLINVAGGPAPDADVDQLNLAAPVADGERVYVPRRGEVPPPPPAGPGGHSGAPGGASAGAPGALIDLNTATAAELEQLPGVGPATAKAILDYRQQHGPFRSVDELIEVRGIGEAKLAAVRDLVRV